jgi:integrase/recombinase XerD
MFDRYFCPWVAARLRASPDSDWLSSFLVVLDSRGQARPYVQRYLREAELFGIWLRKRRRTLARLTDDDVRAFARRPPLGRLRCTPFAACRLLLRHLRSRRLVPRPAAEFSNGIERAIAAFDAHLRDVVGLAPATRLYRRRYVRQFLRSVFGAGTIHWSRLRADHVRSFVAAFGQRGKAASAPAAGVSIRSLLRWLQFRGLVRVGFESAVPCVPHWRLTTLPCVLADPQLAAILATFDRATPVGRRDYAMAACLIDLGLRAGEVAELSLADVDLANGTIRLRAGKPRRERILPLPERVRQAIHDYVRQGRPTTRDLRLFVRHRLPVGTAVSRELVRAVIRRAYAAVPGCEHLTGTHILRHSMASRLLRAGADLKRIADILGHRSIDTTAIYAKIDEDRLAAVALPWPTSGEVLP